MHSLSPHELPLSLLLLWLLSHYLSINIHFFEVFLLFVFLLILTPKLDSLLRILLLLLSLHVLFLNTFPFRFELPLPFDFIHLLLDFWLGLLHIRMEHHIPSAQTLFYLHQLQSQSRSQLMQLNSHIAILLLVLEIIWQYDFGLRDVISFTLGGYITATGIDVVSDVIVSGKVGHFVSVNQSLQGFVDRSLPSTYSIMTKLYVLRLALSVCIFLRVVTY